LRVQNKDHRLILDEDGLVIGISVTFKVTDDEIHRSVSYKAHEDDLGIHDGYEPNHFTQTILDDFCALIYHEQVKEIAEASLANRKAKLEKAII